jgi:hypothetical protein
MTTGEALLTSQPVPLRILAISRDLVVTKPKLAHVLVAVTDEESSEPPPQAESPNASSRAKPVVKREKRCRIVIGTSE